MVRDIEQIDLGGVELDSKYMSAADYALDVAKNVEANEATRGTSENTRQAYEQVRNKNEYGWTDTSGVHHNGRVDNETERQAAERNRQTAFTASESARQSTFNNNENGDTVYKVGTKVLLKTIDASTGSQKIVEINGKDYLQWSDDDDDNPERYTLKGKHIQNGDDVYTYESELLTRIGALTVIKSRQVEFDDNEEIRNETFEENEEYRTEAFADNEGATIGFISEYANGIEKSFVDRVPEMDKIISGVKYYYWRTEDRSTGVWVKREYPLDGDKTYGVSSYPTPKAIESNYPVKIPSRWDAFRQQEGSTSDTINATRWGAYNVQESNRNIKYNSTEGTSADIGFDATTESGSKTFVRYSSNDTTINSVKYYGWKSTSGSVTVWTLNLDVKNNNDLYSVTSYPTASASILSYKAVVSSRWKKFNNAELYRDSTASYATTQGNYAKTQGDYAKTQGDNAKSIYTQVKTAYESGQFKGDKGDKGDSGENGFVMYPKFELVVEDGSSYDGHLKCVVPDGSASYITADLTDGHLKLEV